MDNLEKQENKYLEQVKMDEHQRHASAKAILCLSAKPTSQTTDEIEMFFGDQMLKFKSAQTPLSKGDNRKRYYIHNATDNDLTEFVKVMAEAYTVECKRLR